MDLPGYTLKHPIAAGGMAEVFEATQHSLRRTVAVKIMKADDASSAERFMQEARLVAALNHPHIVHIYDVGMLADGRPYLSMELLAGGDLRHRLQSGLTDADIRRIFRQLAEGLVVVHQAGIIHRDIKPANILFRSNGDAVLSDFGIAKSAHVDSELTQAGTVVGSPAYSSPEQVSALPLDGRSDLYSLGVVLVEMLLGSNPFRAKDYGTTVVNQLQMPAPRLPASQQHWQAIVDRLLAKNPAERYADAAELLRAVTGGGADTARMPEAVGTAGADADATVVHAALPLSGGPVALWRDRRVQAGAGVLVLLLALAGWWFTGRADPQVVEWLDRAEQRFELDQLNNPPGDNAVFYYRLVLEREQDNRQARQGLDRVAARYAELARAAREEGNFRKALEYVERGLAIRPDDADLLALDAGIREQMRANRKGLGKFLDGLFGQ